MRLPRTTTLVLLHKSFERVLRVSPSSKITGSVLYCREVVAFTYFLDCISILPFNFELKGGNPTFVTKKRITKEKSYIQKEKKTVSFLMELKRHFEIKKEKNHKRTKKIPKERVLKKL